MIAAIPHVAALLADAVTGVNALLASVPVTPARPVPSVDVITVLDTPWLARGLLDPESLLTLDAEQLERPVLAVSFPNAQDAAFALPVTAAEAAKGVPVPVLIRYLGRSDASDLLLLDAYCTLRAAMRVLVTRGALSGGASNPKTDLRDGCVISPPVGAHFLPVAQTLGDVLLAGGVHVVLPVRDRWIVGGASGA